MRALLLALLVGSAQAAPTDLFVEITKDTGPSEVVEVIAATPSPLLTGYQSKIRKCDLLVNKGRFDPVGELAVIEVVHEAGHCLALRNGLTNLDAPNINIEKIADVYAVAWMYYNRKDLYERSVYLLLQQRMENRRRDRLYDTLLAIRWMQKLLPMVPPTDPWELTVRMFKE